MRSDTPLQQHITNTLLLNASFVDNLGLMHGKMGIAIYFFHLARETKNPIYEEYAGELIDEIYEEITTDTPTDFENGLAGIGWGIECLVQNGFIEADTDEILDDFDNRLFKKLIYDTPNEIGLLDGLVGLGAYFLKRIQNPQSNDENIKTLTNKQLLIHLIDELERRFGNGGIEKLLNDFVAKGSNKQKVYGSNDHSFSNDTETFDLTHDYPVLIWFLAELHELDIFNFKVEKLIDNLSEPLSDQVNWPQLNSNRLLLALSLTKLLPAIRNIETTDAIESISKTILTNISKEKIDEELPTANTTLRFGTSGIAWIYRQLYMLTGKEEYQYETQYWQDRHCENSISNSRLKVFEFEDSTNAFGLLEGMAGTIHFLD